MTPGTDERADDESDWRFSLDEVGDDESTGGGGNVAGSVVEREPLEPQQIDLTNAAFFLLGSLGTILFIGLALLGL